VEALIAVDQNAKCSVKSPLHTVEGKRGMCMLNGVVCVCSAVCNSLVLFLCVFIFVFVDIVIIFVFVNGRNPSKSYVYLVIRRT